MKLDFAIFADSAILADNGLFSLLGGGIEWIEAPALPATCQHLVLLARFSFEAGECGKNYECVVEVTDPGGNVLTPNLSVTLKPAANPTHPESPSTFTARYGYDGFTMEHVGRYRFRFVIGDLSPGDAALEARVRART